MLILFYILHSFSIKAAEVSRAPAVLESSCDLNISTENLTLIEIQKIQCKKVQQCMNSANDEDMPELRKLAALACSNDIKPITTAIPSVEINKALIDKNSRKEKFPNQEMIGTPSTGTTAIEK